jgi:hypothetical protein
MALCVRQPRKPAFASGRDRGKSPLQRDPFIYH